MGFWSTLGSALGMVGGAVAGNLIAPGVGGIFVGSAVGAGLGGGIGAQFDPLTGQYVYPQQQQEYPASASIPDYTQQIVQAYPPVQRGFLDVSEQRVESLTDYEDLLNTLDQFNQRGL